MAFLLTFSGGASATYKDAVRVARDSQLALSGATPLVIDGITLVDKDRVLLRGQTAPAENGIYVCAIAGGAYTLTRALDANNDKEVLPNMLVPVAQGTSNADKIFQLVSPNVAPIDLDTDALVFTDVLIGLANKADRDLANLLPTAINQSLLFGDDTSYNIGAAAASRPQTLYVKTAINLASLTASKVVGSDGSKNLVSSSVLTTDMETSVSDTQAATNAATANTIVKRDLNSEITLKALNLDGATSGTLNIYPAATTTNYSVTLPAAQGAASTFLQNNGSGTLSWTAVPDPLPSQTGNQQKVLATDGTTASWRYAGLGDGSFGTNNIILGRGKPGTLTTGTDNVLFGSSAGNNITTATNSFLVNANLRAANESYEININGYLRVQPAYYSAIGIGHTNALNPYVVSIGSGAGNGAVNRSVSIGRNSGNNAGNSAISIGDGAGGGNGGGLGGTGAISIGAAAQQYNGSVNSIAIGTLAAQGASPSGSGYNTIIGSYAGYNLNTGAFNSVLGAYSLYTSNSKNNCVGIGSYAGYNANTANEFYLDSRSSALASNALEKTNSLMYGTFNATAASQTLSLNAQVNLAYGERHAVATKTATPISVAASDYTIAVDTATIAGASAVNLPAISAGDAGRVYVIKDLTGSAATNNITVNVAAGSGNLIDGASSQTISVAYGSLTLQSDGSNRWMIL